MPFLALLLAPLATLYAGDASKPSSPPLAVDGKAPSDAFQKLQMTRVTLPIRPLAPGGLPWADETVSGLVPVL